MVWLPSLISIEVTGKSFCNPSEELSTILCKTNDVASANSSASNVTKVFPIQSLSFSSIPTPVENLPVIDSFNKLEYLPFFI